MLLLRRIKLSGLSLIAISVGSGICSASSFSLLHCPKISNAPLSIVRRLPSALGPTLNRKLDRYLRQTAKLLIRWLNFKEYKTYKKNSHRHVSSFYLCIKSYFKICGFHRPLYVHYCLHGSLRDRRHRRHFL